MKRRHSGFEPVPKELREKISCSVLAMPATVQSIIPCLFHLDDCPMYMYLIPECHGL